MPANAILLALALLAQPSQPQQPQRPEGVAPREPSPGQAMFEAERMASDREAQVAMHRFGACVADRSPQAVAELLALDFRTPQYRTGLRTLGEQNGTCLNVRGRMRSAQLLFAGAIAERLIERDRAPLNVRLARAALQPATAAFAPSDALAICVVRSVPDQVAQLFASSPTTREEAAAVAALRPAADLCAGSRSRVEGSDAAMRAILATAAFRTLRAAAPANVAGN
jgi:hypothetical protein